MLPGSETTASSTKHELADLRRSQDFMSRVADSGELDHPLVDGQAGRVSEPADVPVIVEATLEPIRALRHGGGTHLEQKPGAVAVLRAEHDGDVTGEIALS